MRNVSWSTPVLILAVMICVIVIADAALAVPASAQDISGTYRVWQCTEPCAPRDSAKAIATATLVLFPPDMGEGIHGSLERMRMPYIGDRELNACFAVHKDHLVTPLKSFFGIVRLSATTWEEYSSGEINIKVYGSPDASYEFRLKSSDSGLQGEGWSRGSSSSTVWHRDAFILAVREGDADIGACKE